LEEFPEQMWQRGAAIAAAEPTACDGAALPRQG
jgi:hypothetical protein